MVQQTRVVVSAVALLVAACGAAPGDTAGTMVEAATSVTTTPGSTTSVSDTPSVPTTSVSTTAPPEGPSTTETLTDPAGVCDEVAASSGEDWAVARAETATAAEVAGWEEALADGRIVSSYRQNPPSEELAVCLFWGFIPAPGPPPGWESSGVPYDASIFVVDSAGEARLIVAGTQVGLTELPSDFVADLLDTSTVAGLPDEQVRQIYGDAIARLCRRAECDDRALLVRLDPDVPAIREVITEARPAAQFGVFPDLGSLSTWPPDGLRLDLEEEQPTEAGVVRLIAGWSVARTSGEGYRFIYRWDGEHWKWYDPTIEEGVTTTTSTN